MTINLLKSFKISGLDLNIIAGGLNLTSHIDFNDNRFSGGELQRMAIARALYQDSKVIVMDEPTSALDDKLELDFLASLTK